jgi:hypothetical protein
MQVVVTRNNDGQSWWCLGALCECSRMIALLFLVRLLFVDLLVIVLLFVFLLALLVIMVVRVRALGMSVIGIPLWTKTQTMT